MLIVFILFVYLHIHIISDTNCILYVYIVNRTLFAHPKQGAWLYVLMARLEKPLYRDMASLLRQCFRFCYRCRCDLSPSESSQDGQLAELNTLIAITGSYFGQGEVYDSRQHIDTCSNSGLDNAGEDLLDGDDEVEDEDEDDDGVYGYNDNGYNGAVIDDENDVNMQEVLYDYHAPRQHSTTDVDNQSIEDGEIV